MEKVHIRCYNGSADFADDTTWFEFPNGVACRLSLEEVKWCKSWRELYNKFCVPFLFY